MNSWEVEVALTHSKATPAPWDDDDVSAVGSVRREFCPNFASDYTLTPLSHFLLSISVTLKVQRTQTKPIWEGVCVEARERGGVGTRTQMLGLRLPSHVDTVPAWVGLDHTEWPLLVASCGSVLSFDSLSSALFSFAFSFLLLKQKLSWSFVFSIPHAS